jgi:hypothetical protein
VDLAKQDHAVRRGITMPMLPLPLNDQSEPIPVFEWDVVNESKGGLRVRRLGRTEQPIAVGEVAGIKLHGRATGPSVRCAGSRSSTTAAWNSGCSTWRRSPDP